MNEYEAILNEMKVYLVGGAVRDQLLGYPVMERDWVVIGGTPEQLIQQGYTQVGKDFPVFLHPKTREEYALARTERKRSVGYYGFSVDFNPKVTLEEDLARRDLTINAMAMDDKGILIDPFHGQDDLHHKCLRHVSPAFIEDPVRVLRIARFVSRYHHLGFKLAEETRQLMVDMVKQGELAHLVPERVWQEFLRSLEERNPEQFIWTLRSCGALRVVIPELDLFFGIPNPPEQCPMIDTGIQALEALKKTTASTPDPMLRFAALIHLIGNVTTPMINWPYHYPSMQSIAFVVDKLCQRLRIPKESNHLARITAQFYYDIQRFPDLQAEEIVSILEQCDAFRRPQWLHQLLQVADLIAESPRFQHAKNWQIILERCGKINAQSLIDQGFQGEEIKRGLHQKRVKITETWVSQWKKNEKQQKFNLDRSRNDRAQSRNR